MTAAYMQLSKRYSRHEVIFMQFFSPKGVTFKAQVVFQNQLKTKKQHTKTNLHIEVCI